MRIRLPLLLVTLVTSLFLTASPSAALSCVGRPDGLEEATITGVPLTDAMYVELDVPVVMGIVLEGTSTDVDHNAGPGERLALVEVIAGLRLDSVPHEVEVVTDMLTGWGYPTYAAGEHVFLRVNEGDTAERFDDGPCSFNSRFTRDQIDGFLTLAKENAVPIVFPVEEAPETTVPATTSVAPATTAPEVTAPGTESDSSAEDGVPVGIVILVVMAGLAAATAIGYRASRR
ncbi:MAG: hypothetical protein ACI9C1_000677 [Candidatus Aldehydirespiratoraceae bacterium]|jgi:hypothetical protein